MRQNIMQWICCPSCGADLSLETFEAEGKEVLAGALHCAGCAGVYPIIGGVPRLLTGKLQSDLQPQYPDFFRRYGLDPAAGHGEEDKELVSKRKTQSRFGYEWTRFDDYACDNFPDFVAPLPEHFFSGKLGLDVGCGAGRHIMRASQMGAEMIGVDVSQAVDAAYRNNAGDDNVHILQADVYHLPFRQAQFDFIYSLGVLHHLPAPEQAFHLLPAYLKPGGSLFVWLYAYMPRKMMLESLRIISQRLSNQGIHRMAWLCNLVDYGVFINLYKLLVKQPRIGRFFEHAAPLRVREYAGYGYQVSLTDWYDRLSAPITNYYTEEKMQQWLAHSSLGHTQLQAVGDSWWWLYGEAH